MATIEFEEAVDSNLSGYQFEKAPVVGEKLYSWSGREVLISEITEIQHQQREGFFELVVKCKTLERYLQS